MSMVSENRGLAIQRLVADIVSAYVAHHDLSANELPDLIRNVREALSTAGRVETAPERPMPAVPPKKSVFPDYIVCLEDGKKLKLLKRHIMTVYNLTPEQYRERWDLPSDYPMVAPNYASHRSSLARKIGLGTRRG